jgi:hypothetical protein
MSAAEEIAKFYELFKIGAITEAEFTAAKASLIGTSATPHNAPKGYAAVSTPNVNNNVNKNTKGKSKSAQRPSGIPNAVQTGAAVAAGVVGGRLLSDKLLNDPSTDQAAFATETITFPDGDTISGSAVEMPNGDVFYSITESTETSIHTVTGALTAQEVEELNQDYSDHQGDIHHHHHHHDGSAHVSEPDSGNFDNFDFF